MYDEQLNKDKLDVILQDINYNYDELKNNEQELYYFVKKYKEFFESKGFVVNIIENKYDINRYKIDKEIMKYERYKNMFK